MPADIPGFYYDEDKKKYFRIQRNHVLPKSSTVHTKQSVKAIKTQRQTQISQQQRDHRVRIGSVRRSLLASTLSYKLLDHQSRGRRSTQKLVANLFASNISSRPAYDPSYISLDFRSRIAVSTFDLSEDGCLTTVFQRPMRFIGRDSPSITEDPEDFAYHPELQGPRNHSGGTLPDWYKVQLVCAYRPPLRQSVIVSNCYTVIACFNLQGRQNAIVERIGPITTTVWDIAVSPWNGDIAVARGDGLFLSTPDPERLCHPIASGPTTTREQMNVTFKDRNIVVSGERSGRVNFCDVRSRDSVLRLQHSSAVLGTLQGKHSELLIVHGFSTTSIYDLRYSKAISPSSDRSFRRGFSHHSSQNRRRRYTHNNSSTTTSPTTKPYLDFSIPKGRHSDYYTLGRKLAYSSDLDIIIAASSNSSPPIHTQPSQSHPNTSTSTSTFTLHQQQINQNIDNHNKTNNHVTLYSAKTGHPLPGPLTNNPFTNPITSLGLARLRDGPESILTLSSNGNLLEWTIHHSFHDDCFVQNTSREMIGDLCVRGECVGALERKRMKGAGKKVGGPGMRIRDVSVARLWREGNLGPGAAVL